ncbi:hypothetical protein LX32DRAFT_636176 [Colletotrichum zoysiae]|uniref:Uncharacterized protein n=1 Tax=Colletotrichum zoysiae TaxID=1216348 RepID=A0AAD9HP02_9PEZI|nr:hypothetical protein LX32DRAFT_636176 [Colletotrichum zoysiae]
MAAGQDCVPGFGPRSTGSLMPTIGPAMAHGLCIETESGWQDEPAKPRFSQWLELRAKYG